MEVNTDDRTRRNVVYVFQNREDEDYNLPSLPTKNVEIPNVGDVIFDHEIFYEVTGRAYDYSTSKNVVVIKVVRPKTQMYRFSIQTVTVSERERPDWENEPISIVVDAWDAHDAFAKVNEVLGNPPLLRHRAKRIISVSPVG